ncbi:MAG: prolyl oligopeptidase family serine peptidase [Candidatus Omnitrophica bacterium]|nr:prolyl oligopeptidase family serine peptidase [Candidatus Omnitrophota bacterium]
MFLRPLCFVWAAVCLAIFTWSAPAQETPSSSPVIRLDRALVIESIGRSGRAAVHTDTLEARIVAGQWQAPNAGETVRAASGIERKWEWASADKDGQLTERALRGGYVYWPVNSAAEKVMILEAAGHSLVYVNGQIRAGDPYQFGYVRLPVLLRAGTNDFLFQCSRGRLRAQLTTPTGPVMFSAADNTLPDIVPGDKGPLWGAVVVVNATTHSMPVALRAKDANFQPQTANLPPFGIKKMPFLLARPDVDEPGDCRITLELAYPDEGQERRIQSQITLRVRRPDQTCKRTFVSAIDDSVQYYAVNPACPTRLPAPPPALFLSLHGAGVEAIGQADACSPKTWGYLVCPTNRRPFGFDWEDWGRWDALEVLALAEARFHVDPARVYLTGHSMGGHGTWQLGALFPSLFAAIGPSAGWISFASYVRPNRSETTNTAANPVQKMLERSAAACNTLLMSSNYLEQGVYILHGSADDNVPVSQARQMREVLSRFHHDFVYYEQPGAGHWWDASDEPGADCTDWAPMFDFFARHVIPSDQELRRVQFVTVNPAVSSHCHWVVIAAQLRCLEPSAVDVRCDPGKQRLVGTTANVTRLWLGLPSLTPGKPLTVDLDGQRIENISWPQSVASSLSADLPDGEPGIWLDRGDGNWRISSAPSPALKSPRRSGPFRQAFANHMIFVYGTHGTSEENAWALDKARYDSETFWYRGNGAVELMSDTAFLEGERQRQPSQTSAPRRNVILYGHAESNSAWPILLADSPVQVHRGSVRIGSRELDGENLACLFLQPYPKSDTALVGVVTGSGLPGLRLTDRLPYFLSGAGFPDCLVISTAMLDKGIGGIRAAGFFGQDWKVDTGEFAWDSDSSQGPQ